jgi:hypothetical protein
MTGIAEWLASIGLGEYAQRFSENAIDLSIVRDLTEQDLKDLGVLLGHRRKLLRAIAELKGDVLPTPPGTQPTPRDSAERRQLTVMFCDLVGSSALSVRRRPYRSRSQKPRVGSPLLMVTPAQQPCECRTFQHYSRSKVLQVPEWPIPFFRWARARG